MICWKWMLIFIYFEYIKMLETTLLAHPWITNYKFMKCDYHVRMNGGLTTHDLMIKDFEKSYTRNIRQNSIKAHSAPSSWVMVCHQWIVENYPKLDVITHLLNILQIWREAKMMEDKANIKERAKTQIISLNLDIEKTNE